jgi:hypothetical protein
MGESGLVLAPAPVGRLDLRFDRFTFPTPCHTSLYVARCGPRMSVFRWFQRGAEARPDMAALPQNARVAHCSHSSPSRLRICFQLCGRVTTHPHKVRESPED